MAVRTTLSHVIGALDVMVAHQAAVEVARRRAAEAAVEANGQTTVPPYEAAHEQPTGQ